MCPPLRGSNGHDSREHDERCIDENVTPAYQQFAADVAGTNAVEHAEHGEGNDPEVERGEALG